ncbi:MAG TPA: YlxR family protein [Xenococcaceae cyanobacterium]
MKPNHRRCVSCRQIFPKKQLWRVVKIHPSQQVCLDSGMGRSAYICFRAECLQQARQKNAFGRSLKVKIPQYIYQSLQKRLNSEYSPRDQT